MFSGANTQILAIYAKLTHPTLSKAIEEISQNGQGRPLDSLFSSTVTCRLLPQVLHYDHDWSSKTAHLHS